MLSRRAAGETFRQLAPAYGVAHTMLGRYFAFARPEVGQALRAERWLARELRRQVRQQAAADLHSAAAKLPSAPSRPVAVRRP